VRRNHGFSSVVGLSCLLFSIACSSTPAGPTPCTDATGCAAGEYCLPDGGCAMKLAAGSPCAPGTGHTADDLCSSSVCGGGRCCTAACASTDTACASTGCDSTGACLYPDAGATCGTAAGCNGANFVPDSTCNGAGGCAAATPVSCSPYLCQNGGCSTSCRATAECDTGNYCSSGVCIAKLTPGANCNGTSTSAPGEACGSNVCIGNHCCTAACSTTDPICHANACDTTGACLYPDTTTTCGPLETCTAGQHTPPSGCGGDGTCVLSVPASCGVYNCDSVGKSCYTSCTVGDDSPCTTGNFCKAGACAPQQAPGAPCLAPDACISGICQTNCCTAACDVDATTNCQGSCDNAGACGHPTCAPGYGCSGSATCNTSCTVDADCAPGSGYTCSSPISGFCCLPPVAGGTIFVDGALGSDTNCCDSATTACLTITHAMSKIFLAGATGVTMNVSWNGQPTVRSDWAPATAESYPIHLGMGVTLNAPGVFFTPPAGAPVDVFDVFAFNANDTGTVTIAGDPTVDYAFIGIDSTQSNLQSTAIAVNSGIGTAVPLVLSYVWMNGQSEALNLGAGAKVTLGSNDVIIGGGLSTPNPLPVSSPGNEILCQGSTTSRATLQDDPRGVSILQIDSQDTNHITGSLAELYAADNCDVTLTQSPIMGPPPPCNNPKLDGEGVLLSGTSTATLTGATFQCLFNHGIDLGETPLFGSPTLTLDSSLIQHTGQTGLKVNGGSVGPVTNTSVYHCRFGVAIQGTGALDLSAGGNIVACNTNAELGAFEQAPGRVTGIDVWNSSSLNNLSLNASNVLWDDNPPVIWSCSDIFGDGAFTLAGKDCTCVSGGCSGTGVPLPDGTDAAYYSGNTNAVPIDTSNPGLQNKFVCN